MVILDDGYFIPADDWLRVVRRLRSAVKGDGIPESERLYVDVDNVGILPHWMVIYRDGDEKYFVKKSDAVRWHDFKRFKGIFHEG